MSFPKVSLFLSVSCVLQNIDNETVTNHYDVVNNISNSSVEEDDEPPPLPPPRGESLGRSIMTDVTPSPTTENGLCTSFCFVFSFLA